MQAVKAAASAGRKKLRQFVVRLEDGPGSLYERLFNLSVRRSQLATDRVPMTQLVREAIVQYLSREEKKYGL